MTDADFTEPAYLVKNGVPFDVAFSMPPRYRLAMCVFFGQMEGGEWDFSRMDWKPPRQP